MSEHHFGLYRGHLSAGLIKRVEAKFREVSVTNYSDPRGENRRGWFAGPNRGAPFDAAMASEVMTYARSIAKGRDRDVLGCDEAET